MDETKQKIADMVSDMHFERKKPIPKQTKQEMVMLYDSLGEVLAKINKLHLALWYAQEKNDYRSTSLTDAKNELGQIWDEINKILK